MQQQTKLLFLFVFLWLVNKAQGQDESKRAENTILRVAPPDRYYSDNKLAWFNKNGFETNSYDWNSLEINQFLSKASKEKTGAQITGWISAGTLLGALLVNGLVEISKSTQSESSNDGPVYQMMYSLYTVSGSLAVTSIIAACQSRRHIRKATRLGKSRVTKSNAPKLKPTDLD